MSEEKLATLITSSSKNKKNRILLSSDTVVNDPKIVEKMFDDAIEHGLEGILAKTRRSVSVWSKGMELDQV